MYISLDWSSTTICIYTCIFSQVSLVAVLFRQTNILWTVFIAGAAFVTNFEQRISMLKSVRVHVYIYMYNVRV